MAEWKKNELLHFSSVPRSLSAESPMFTRRQVGESSTTCNTIVFGGMAEWLKAAVLKTVRDESPSRVRISLPPLEQKHLDFFQMLLFIGSEMRTVFDVSDYS